MIDNKIILVILAVIMVSCASNFISESEAYKRINYPGLPSQKPYVSYTIQFDSSVIFGIKEVKLNNKAIKFDVLTKQEKAYTRNLSNLSAGAYVISFKQDDITNIANKENVVLIYTIDDKEHKKEFQLEKREPLRGK